MATANLTNDADPVEVAILDSAWYQWEPRPNRPELFDEQTAFCDSKDRVAFLVAGNASGKTSASARKCAKFVLQDQQAPRRDTPFWIIGETYDQVCDVCWGEKLIGEGHLPECEIDWPRIAWHSFKGNQPKSVPLKPWPAEYGGDPRKNWRLEFKSFEQGWQKMQARSIGGFWFSEQFPLELFIEVLRGCRDCMFPGGQFCEFTPLQPDLCLWLEKLMEKPPAGWRFYRCNTECNKPNLTPGWYEDFFAAVPDEMQETRRTGALAVFEGAIYTAFNRAVHVVGDDLIRYPFVPGAQHYIGIDWGASEEHPFAVVWANCDGVGDWHFYDEYWCNAQDKITEDHAVEVLARSLAWGWPQPQSLTEPPTPRLGVFAEQVFGRLYQLRPRGVPPLIGQAFNWAVADPSRPGDINTFNSYGIGCGAAANDVLKGIDCVRSLLRVNPTTGRPKLFIHDRCRHLIEEMRKYRWQRSRKPTSGILLNPNVAQVKPLMRDEDCVCAARYLLYTAEMQRGAAPGSTSHRDFTERRRSVQLDRGMARAGVWGMGGNVNGNRQ